MQPSDAEQRAQLYLDAVAIMLLALDTQGNIEMINPVGCQLLGYSPDELTGKNWFDLCLPAAIREEMRTSFLEIMRGKADFQPDFENPVITSTGEERLIKWHNVRLTKSEAGKVLGSISSAEDVTEKRQAEEALRLSEERFRILLNLISDYAFSIRVDADGTLTSEWMSEKFQRWSGYGVEEVFPTTLFHQDETERVRQDLVKVLAGEATEGEYRIIIKSGETRWVYIRRLPVWDEKEGRVIRYYGVEQDITERKQAEEALRLSEEGHRIVLDLISDYAFACRVNSDGSFNLEWATDKFQAWAGYQPDEVINTSTLFHPNELERVSQDFKNLVAGKVTQGEYRIITKSGETRWVHIRRQPVWDEQEGRVIRYYGVEQDITERKRAEEALRVSEERYRIVLDLISDYAFANRVNTDGTFTCEWVTDKLHRWTGYTLEELINTPTLYHPDEIERLHHDLKRLMAGEATQGEYRILAKSGETRWLHIRRQPVWDEQEGRVIRYYGVEQDITERKRAEEALRISEERYRIVSELISDYAFSCRVEPDGSILNEWITGSYTRLTGLIPYEDSVPIKFYHPDDMPLAEKDVAQTLAGKASVGEYRFFNRDGDVGWLYIRRLPVWDEKEQRVVRYYGVSQNITEQKKAEAALRESESTARALLEAPTDSVMLLDTNGIILDCNTTMLQRHNKSVDELRGVDIFSLFSSEAAHKRRDYFQHILTTKVPTRFEDERDDYVYDNVFYPIFDPAGNISKVAVVARDITEMKRAEQVLREREARKREMEFQFEREKAQLLAVFVQDAAHEFRTPLSIISSMAYLLSRAKTAEEQQQRVSKIYMQIQAITNLLEGMLKIARLDRTINIEPHSIDVKRLLWDVQAAKAAEIGEKRQQIKVDLAPDLPTLQGDPDLLETAFQHLLDNAIKFTPDGGQITVGAKHKNGVIEVTVTDTGIGISETALAHIFEHFYREDSARTLRGFGLGLPIARKIVGLHGGVLVASSEKGRGSVFTALIPAG